MRSLPLWERLGACFLGLRLAVTGGAGELALSRGSGSSQQRIRLQIGPVGLSQWVYFLEAGHTDHDGTGFECEQV